MATVTSKDGTTIAFDKTGQGTAVILVDGALGYRAFGLMGALAPLLAPHFTVVTYDRRGRGESTDTQPFAVEREIEDIEALINPVGGAAFVYGISSGAALALEAALALGSKIKKLAIYDPPYNSDPTSRPAWKEYTTQLREAIAAGRRGDAVALFMKFVGAPDDQLGGMRQSPVWPMMEAVAPTLVYDAAALGGEDRSVPTERAAQVTASTLVMAGGATLPFIQDSAKALAKAIPTAQHRTLEGQTHEVAADAIAPALIEFFLA